MRSRTQTTDTIRTHGTGGKTPTAVRGSTFHVKHSEIFGLLGTKGAGTTSALEILGGLAEPTSGTVRVLGIDPVTGRQRLRPDVGIMLQSGDLPSQITVMTSAWASVTVSDVAFPVSGWL